MQLHLNLYLYWYSALLRALRKLGRAPQTPDQRPICMNQTVAGWFGMKSKKELHESEVAESSLAKKKELHDIQDSKACEFLKNH